MRDNLQSLIDTFFCGVDIDKFYIQNKKEKLAEWLRENGGLFPPVKIGQELWDIHYNRPRKWEVVYLSFNNENLTEDFTAMVFALNMFYNNITGDTMDIIEFTHLLNTLAVQHLMEDHPTEKGGAE